MRRSVTVDSSYDTLPLKPVGDLPPCLGVLPYSGHCLCTEWTLALNFESTFICHSVAECESDPYPHTKDLGF